MSESEIIVTSPIPPELREVLSEEHELIVLDVGQSMPGFDIAVTTSVGGADAALMDRLPDLKLLLCNGTGLENIDLEAAAWRGVIVRNTPDEVVVDTADFAIGLIYAVVRRICEGDRFVRSGSWAHERMTPARRVHNRMVGIVGLGKIGQLIAGKAAGIGMTVYYSGPREKPEQPYTYVETVKALAERVEILVLSCPGGDATRNLVNAEVLNALGAEGTLINVSRGSVVDEEALISALAEGKIASAGLDVFSTEPKIDPRFMEMQNVVLAPHYAAVTTDTRYGIANTLKQAIADYRAGRPVADAAGGHR